MSSSRGTESLFAAIAPQKLPNDGDRPKRNGHRRGDTVVRPGSSDRPIRDRPRSFVHRPGKWVNDR